MKGPCAGRTPCCLPWYFAFPETGGPALGRVPPPVLPFSLWGGSRRGHRRRGNPVRIAPAPSPKLPGG